jgi:hypothetical protein
MYFWRQTKISSKQREEFPVAILSARLLSKHTSLFHVIGCAASHAQAHRVQLTMQNL